MMTPNDTPRPGRPPTGTGGHTIHVSRCNAASWRLIIGKELWRQIGCPARVALVRRGQALYIEATIDEDAGTYAVTGAAASGKRITIGAVTAAQEHGLRLGTSANVRVRAGTIVVELD